MSTKITTSIWSLRGIPSTTKFILVKLGDNANDDGVCWPSVPKIASECEVSERTVQGAIVWAEKCGLIRREMRSGRSTVYHITPAGYSPPQNLHPADCDNTPAEFAPSPPQDIHPTPADCDVAYKEEPSIEPSVETPKNRQSSGMGFPEFFERFWEAFPRQRRGGRQKAFNAYRKSMKRATEEEIYAALIRYSASSDVRRGYAKGAQAWLNDDGWTYQPIATNSSNSANGKPAYGDTIATAIHAVRDHVRAKENLREEEIHG